MKKIPWPIVVHTRRLEIRPYKLTDYENWRDGFTQLKPKQHKFDLAPVKAKKLHRRFYRKLCARHDRLARKDECYAFGIYDRRTQAHLGVIDISTVQRDWYQWASIGYFVHNNYHRRGIAKEALRPILRVAFTKLKYKRIEASILPGNWRSQKTARSLGMKREGIRRDYIFDYGKWQNHVIYVALNPRKTKQSYPLL